MTIILITNIQSFISPTERHAKITSTSYKELRQAIISISRKRNRGWVTDKFSREPQCTFPPSMQHPFKVGWSIITQHRQSYRKQTDSLSHRLRERNAGRYIDQTCRHSWFLLKRCPRPTTTERSVCLHNFFLPLEMWVTQTQNVMSDTISREKTLLMKYWTMYNDTGLTF